MSNNSEVNVENVKSAAELQAELRRVIADQLTGRMDWVRARTYWALRLPVIPADQLAEALTHVLASGSFRKEINSRNQIFA